MLKISREVELGLFLLVDLAKRKKPVSLRSWAEERGLPYRYLSKVAVRLKKVGLLKSKEGREGGYQLGKAAEKIKMMEVTKAIQGTVAPIKCLEGVRCDCEEFCGHRNLMVKLAKAVEKQLSQVSLADLC